MSRRTAIHAFVRAPEPQEMSMRRHVLPFAALAALITLAAACGNGQASAGPTAPAASSSSVEATPLPPATRIPRLVDVGAGKCIPCKAMAPILDQLRTDYAGRFDVQFVDVWVSPDAADPYRIRLIPTQIFYGADGRELSRHEGFMSREDILARWKTHGLPF
jgi:thioredoxin 1